MIDRIRQGRGGRKPGCWNPTKGQLFDINEYRNKSRLRANYLIHEWLHSDRPLEVLIPTAMQLVLKDMPDKQEIVSLSLSLQPEQATKLLELYERNLLVLKELEQARADRSRPKQDAVTVDVKPLADGPKDSA